MSAITTFDTDLFLFLNGLHADCLDGFMVFVSQNASSIVFFLIFMILAAFKYGKKSLWILLGLVIVVLLADQISAHLIKPLVQRPRPCHNPDISEFVHLPSGRCGGAYGFVSSHAANCFACAVFLGRILKPHVRWVKWPLYVWAAVVSYSRIYLGVHYPLDIVCGTALGILIGVGMEMAVSKFVKTN